MPQYYPYANLSSFLPLPWECSRHWEMRKCFNLELVRDMSCLLNTSGWKILRTSMNLQATPALKNGFPVYIFLLPVYFSLLPVSQEVLKQEVISSHLLGILPRCSNHKHSPQPCPGHGLTISALHPLTQVHLWVSWPNWWSQTFHNYYRCQRHGNKARGCAEIWLSRSKKEHSSSQHFLPKMISESSVPIHSKQKTQF